MNKRTKGIAFAVLGGVLWGLSGVCAQYLFQYKGLNAPWLVGIRLVCAGIMILALSYIKREGRDAVINIWKEKRDALELILFSVFGMGACQFTYYSAVETSNAGTATVLSYTAPALIMIWVSLKLRKLPTVAEIFALILAVGGVFLLATHGDLNNLAISEMGLVWGLISSVTLAAYSLIPVRVMHKFGTLPVLGWGMLISGVILNFFTRPWDVPGIWDGKTFLFLAIAIVLGTVMSFSLYLEGVRLIGAAKASLFATSEPLMATISVAVFLNVSFMLPDLIGLIMIICATVILTVFKGNLED